MEPIPAAAELSVRRSRNRHRVLVVLSSLGEAYVGQIMRMTGLERRSVRGALVGAPPGYRPGLSLVALGLARELSTPNGRIFAITPRGRRKARALTARRRR